MFIYDNNEDGGAQASDVQDFIDARFATWHLLDGGAFSGQAQNTAYQHCLRTYGPYVSWMAEIDADEFLAVEDAAARRLPPARRLKAVLGDFRFAPGARSRLCSCGSRADVPHTAMDARSCGCDCLNNCAGQSAASCRN